MRESGDRLVTLVGPGGVGKTRLAIEAAGRVAGDFADGARFVALAAVSEFRDLASAIARALAAPVSEGESAQAALLRFLSSRQLLLVLDNFEQLVEGAPLVGDLIARLSGADGPGDKPRADATRCRAALSGAPARGAGRLGERRAIELERYGAVAMFCDRARARDPAFTLDESTGPPVSEICRRLEGLPLALELAAARTGLLSVSELAARLDGVLAVLVGGARDAPKRQRTLRATIDWSYTLLTAEERSAFAHMAVFAGGATVAMAEAVTGASLDTLDSLVAKQLLARRDERLLMLETVREYALERLAEDPDRDAVYERLAAWCLDFLREATPISCGRTERHGWPSSTPSCRTRSRRCPGALEQRDARTRPAARRRAGRLLVAHASLRRWASLDRCRAGAGARRLPSPASRPRCLTRGASRTSGSRTSPTAPTCRPASSSTAPATTPGGIAACLGHLAFAETWAGNYEQATALSEQAVRYAERTQDEAVIAFARVQAASVRGRLRGGRTPRPQRFAISAPRRQSRRVGTCVRDAGYVAIAERRYREALAWLDEALDAARRLDDPRELFVIHGNQGLARLFLHELEDAGQHFCDALAVCREAGHQTMRGSTRLSSASPPSRRHAASSGAPPASRERPKHIKPGTASSTKRPSGHDWSTTSRRLATAAVPSAGTSPSARERS